MIRFLFFALYIAIGAANAQNQTKWKFDFGPGKPMKGFVQVLPSDSFSTARGFGFITEDALEGKSNTGRNALTNDYVTSLKPFYFSVVVPEGDYNVRIHFGDLNGSSELTVRSECRRLMLPVTTTPQGVVESREFTVHVRTPAIASSPDSVRLKARERDYLHWDNQITLEFNGRSPKICGIEIEKTEAVTRVFLAGNSTVVDQAEEPYAAWGQIIPSFLQSGKVSVANYAESGESLLAFRREKRLAKILSLLKPGDYVFIEFAHNDQKPGGNHLDAFTTYKETLKEYIAEIRKRMGIPVLVTSMHRRKFDDHGKIENTLENYPEAVRQTGKEENVVVIDLNAMSKILYEAWGPEKSIQAFVHYPANTFPGQTTELKDNTHFSPYGAYQLAKCVVEGIRTSDLGLKAFLIPNLKSFDPAKPDPIESFVWPRNTRVAAKKPDGN
jgi:lysophospholipase L1-like esterase